MSWIQTKKIDGLANDRSAVAIATFIRSNAAKYRLSTGSSNLKVQPIAKSHRRLSILYRFKVTGAGNELYLLAKVPYQSPADQTSDELDSASSIKPFLTDTVPIERRFWLEYNALIAVRDHFNQIADPCFGAIQLVDYFEDQQAILMEELHYPILRDMMFKNSRLWPALFKKDLSAPLRNVGGWLRHYHNLPGNPYVQERHTGTRDFCENISKLTDFLIENDAGKSLLGQVREWTLTQADKILPQRLPLGLGHGDFAMRNIFVSPQNQVTVIDTLARWRLPRYEDLGYFLTELHSSALQIYMQGLIFSEKLLEKYETAFLAGYFDPDPIPKQAVHLFQILTTLDKWATAVDQISLSSRSNYSRRKLIRLFIINRFYQRRTAQLIK